MDRMQPEALAASMGVRAAVRTGVCAAVPAVMPAAGMAALPTVPTVGSARAVGGRRGRPRAEHLHR